MLSLKTPLACVWEITNKCNFSCPHCRAYMEKPSENTEVENKIIEQLIKSEVLSVNISGGEPLLNPRLTQIVKKLTSNSIDVGISTNGYIYRQKALELLDAGISFVQISIDGPKVVHDQFRGVNGAYDNAILAMKEAKKNGHFVQMNTTITSFNIQYVFDNIKLAEDLGINRIFFRRVVSAGLAGSNDSVLPEKREYIELLKTLLQCKYSGHYKVNISIDDPIISVLDKERYDQTSICCSAGITSLGIDSCGNVFPCIFVREKIGNLQSDDLQKIWKESETLNKIRTRNIKVCGTCEYKWSCGGCRGTAGIGEWDYMCPLL